MFLRQQQDDRDLNAAIEKQRTALLRIVMTLFSLLGITPGSKVLFAPRFVSLSIERVLLSAESAATWLIVAQARTLGGALVGSGDQPDCFDLSARRGLGFGSASDTPDVVSAERLCARLNALFVALQDIPKQARRLIVVQRRIATSVAKGLNRLFPSQDRTDCAVQSQLPGRPARNRENWLAVPGLDSS